MSGYLTSYVVHSRSPTMEYFFLIITHYLLYLGLDVNEPILTTYDTKTVERKANLRECWMIDSRDAKNTERSRLIVNHLSQAEKIEIVYWSIAKRFSSFCETRTSKSQTTPRIRKIVTLNNYYSDIIQPMTYRTRK